MTGCSQQAGPPVSASDVRVFAPLPQQKMTAAYLTIHNNSGAPLDIDRVTSPQFERVEIHETRTDDGVSRMRKVDVLRIAANEHIVLEPGGIHLMLMAPVGDLDQVTLRFFSDDTLLLTTTTGTESR